MCWLPRLPSSGLKKTWWKQNLLHSRVCCSETKWTDPRLTSIWYLVIWYTIRETWNYLEFTLTIRWISISMWASSVRGLSLSRSASQNANFQMFHTIAFQLLCVGVAHLWCCADCQIGTYSVQGIEIRILYIHIRCELWGATGSCKLTNPGTISKEGNIDWSIQVNSQLTPPPPQSCGNYLNVETCAITYTVAKFYSRNIAKVCNTGLCLYQIMAQNFGSGHQMIRYMIQENGTITERIM